MHGRIVAHNGSFGELARLDEQLGPYAKVVLGDTDSERYFALITQQADAHGGNVSAGIAARPSGLPPTCQCRRRIPWSRRRANCGPCAIRVSMP